jgi:hypothetical protein
MTISQMVWTSKRLTLVLEDLKSNEKTGEDAQRRKMDRRWSFKMAGGRSRSRRQSSGNSWFVGVRVTIGGNPRVSGGHSRSGKAQYFSSLPLQKKGFLRKAGGRIGWMVRSWRDGAASGYRARNVQYNHPALSGYGRLLFEVMTSG